MTPPEKPHVITIHTTGERKAAYVRAAKPRGLKDWMLDHLDKAAGFRENPEAQPWQDGPLKALHSPKITRISLGPQFESHTPNVTSKSVAEQIKEQDEVNGWGDKHIHIPPTKGEEIEIEDAQNPKANGKWKVLDVKDNDDGFTLSLEKKGGK